MKIGITTFYYKVYNYGANLQAYALCRVLEKMGYEAEQLCFNTSDGFPEYKFPFPQNIIIEIKVLIASIFLTARHLKYFILYRRRLCAVERFLNKRVPHSKRVYKLSNIAESQKEYDMFITGSDVVWSPITNSPIFFLRFLNRETPKLAYAPSLGTNKLSDEEKRQFHKDLESFVDISIRERSVVPLVAQASGRDVKHCVDSTLLLDEEEWNNVCSKRIVYVPYIFCYFLGNNESAKSLAIEYAKNHNLTLVNIPYYWKSYSKFTDFGDVKLSAVSASEFLSLIKYAHCVFTDSFHACVFSEVFRTEFFAVNRGEGDSLSIRLIDFLTETGAIDHYCVGDDKLTLEYVNCMKNIDFNIVHDRLAKLKEPSKEYLKSNIETVEKLLKMSK
ncbi:polysaccharide pyruvyl transferase family protein [uncultured Bacteroides sp.]|jgi:hypothetical protein|uniref:polysaccharide pyruvyl transferase family protein n=1 Tax=uncultured Bacteroides sp. TaxID=162156 RepID=UPI00258F49ED|nr:polysaccharide pyruvyl transferase family protein [uncultured Bacteroides sp.]